MVCTDFYCTLNNTVVYVDILFDDDEIPRFYYNFGTSSGSDSNPAEVGEIIVTLEKLFWRVYKLCLRESAKSNFHCLLTEDIELCYTDDIFDFESREVTLPEL